MGNIKILLVDDEIFIRELIVDFLEGEDITLVEAESVAQAEEKMAEGPFKVILLDWNLKHGTSGSFLKKLKKKNSQAKVIILTGDHSLLIEEIKNEVVTDLIYKPFQMDDFLNTLKKTWSN